MKCDKLPKRKNREIIRTLILGIGVSFLLITVKTDFMLDYN